MSIPPESIQVGQCYVTHNGQVRRVVRLLPDRVQFEWRNGKSLRKLWKMDVVAFHSFLLPIEREVPCDWTPDADNREPE